MTSQVPQMKGFHYLCVPVVNLWTWIGAPLFSVFQQLFVSMAGSQVLKYKWVSAWVKIWSVAFYFFSLPGRICSLDEFFAEKELQAVWDCLLVTRSCSDAPYVLCSLWLQCIIQEYLTQSSHNLVSFFFCFTLHNLNHKHSILRHNMTISTLKCSSFIQSLA